MVFITRFIGAAAALTFAAAIPMPDSAIGEVAVSAPNGTPISDTAEVAQETAPAQAQVLSAPQVTPAPSYGGSSGYDGSSGYGSSSGYDGSSGYGSSNSYGSSSGYDGSSDYSPSYGSGSSNWGGSGYDSCVQQCVASYGAPPYEYKATGTSDSSSSGSGATHTVIVAPTQGILRYVPFALNASLGDTVKFIWGANNHTVTKSSALAPCNKTGDALFASGTQNQGFEFTQVVNSTDPTFYYCGTPTHCQKGMFGIINPPNALGAPTSVGVMASDMASQDSDMAAIWSSTDQATQGNARAASWGSGIDSTGMPDWSKQYLVENTMYVRSFLAANPDVLKDDGSVDLSNAGTTPLMFPEDFSAALSYGYGGDSSTTSGSTPAAATTTASTSTSPTSSASAANALSNGASSVSSPKLFIGLMAVFATFFAL